ncbi:SDR family NAD(P)-dependent oxidoreductase [Phocaeicola paurosaccharolyticus]|uniref:SDR family NAD(P)-dependent oxidoreductase n=1 Tax=Phocaeicola paurosaccharolyticus TaxID=732242 RepID=UPI00046AC6F8|nr:SDR family oxidoreductase [Phocaeicola paurosaccharolyticus]
MNILITGGTSGLGKATVELLQKDGHQIYFSYLANEKFTAVAKELEDTYSNVKGEPLNFCEDDSVDAFCKKITAWNIDVLVNCTYVGRPQTTYFHKIVPEDFLKAFQFNIIPTVKITQASIDVMKKKKFGKIINIITEAVIGLPPMGYTLYAANKAYLMELSSVWNKEYTRYNITSNCILPAYMQTAFAEVDERILDQMIKNHPLKKLLTPEEVANNIKFFVDASQQVNGVKLQINAGTLLI